MTANIGGHPKKTIVNGLRFTLYSAGNIIGANIFYSNQFPKYISGIIGLITCYSCLMIIGIIYRLLLSYRNKRRNKEQGGYSVVIEHKAAPAIGRGLTKHINISSL